MTDPNLYFKIPPGQAAAYTFRGMDAITTFLKQKEYPFTVVNETITATIGNDKVTISNFYHYQNGLLQWTVEQNGKQTISNGWEQVIKQLNLM